MLGATRRISISTAAACLALATATSATASPLADAGSYDGFASPSGAAVLDTDLDGHPDVAVADGSVATVLRGQAGGGLARVPVPLTASGTPLRVAAADLDADGHDDLILLDESGSVWAWLSRAGGPQPSGSAGLGAGDWRSVGVGDFTGDGKLDVVAGDDAGGYLAVLPGDGAGRLGAPRLSVPVPGVHGLAVGDLDRDGHVDDLGIIDAGTDVAPAQDLYVLTGNGDGTFAMAPGMPFVLPGVPDTVAVRPGRRELVVGDGHAEIVSVGSGGQLTLATGSFTAAPVDQVALADVDGDQEADLLAPSPAAGGGFTLGVYAGFLADPAPLALAAEPDGVATGDVDGDGRVDVVLPEYAHGRFRVLRNTLAPVLRTSVTALTVEGSGPDQVVTVSNAGSYPLSFAGASIAGPDAEHFHIGASTCVRTFSVPGRPAVIRRFGPGESCTVAVGAFPRGTAAHPAWAATLRLETSAGTGDVALAAPAVVAIPVTPIPPPAGPRCVVPKLKGRTLKAARKLLLGARCAVGTVHRPAVRRHHRAQPGTLLVVSQSIAPRARRKVGTKVGLRLAARKAVKHRSTVRRRR